MQMLHLLPDLLTLKINSLSFYGTFSFLNQVFPTTTDDQTIKQLNEMIDDEKLLVDYTIHRELYNIYLTWK